MADHYHLSASRVRKDGTTDGHRFTVATEFIESEQKITHDMGYRVKVELCYDDCLNHNVKS